MKRSRPVSIWITQILMLINFGLMTLGLTFAFLRALVLHPWNLLSVRADLTLLDQTQQQITIESTRDVIVDFRVVRTGRITGLVWFDTNENGRLDAGEQPLPDVRVVTGSGRDTLTDDKGYFIIGDLPPGEHILLLDEKTIPEQTRSITGSQTIKVAGGNETSTLFPVTTLPAQIKKFPR